MRKLLYLLLLIIPFLPSSCSQEIKDPGKDQSSGWQTLTKDYMTWYNYTYYNIQLSKDFIGLDTDSAVIDKSLFLNKLLTDKVFAYKIGTKADTDVYKLYPQNSNDESITATIKGMASTAIQHYKMEGTQMPAFSITDINGTSYDNASTKGKLLVLKCWFIHCAACVKEFPELNKLVSNYRDNDNILFISLAMDKKEELVKFLKTTTFNYATVPGMKEFMTKDLSITQYPTHLLVDKSGKFVKITNRIEELIPFIAKAVK